MNEQRNLEQARVVELYLRDNPFRSTLVLSTGFGKSKVTIDILKHKQPPKIMLLVNSTVLRDFSWVDEFTKFGALDILARTEIATYQLAYKWKKENKDLSGYFIVADEIDFAADTDELAKFFYEYPDLQVMALTGFITETKKEWFRDNLPVLVELSADEAQNKGLLNNIHFVLVKYDLSNNSKDVVVSYTKHGVKKEFTQSEDNAYDYANKQVFILTTELSKINEAFMVGDITKGEQMQKLRSMEYKINMAAGKRRDILLHSNASKLTAKKLIAYIRQQNDKNKIIVFSKRTAQSIAICGEDNVYNGVISKIKAAVNFSNFLSGVSKVLGVCDKVNRGANIDSLNTAIFETFFGSDTNATQRFGRLMRLHPDETATAYILLPYYMRKEKNKRFTVQETQQVKWAKDMLRSTNVKSYEVWDYRTVKENNNETE